jgi:hypothetical protein
MAGRPIPARVILSHHRLYPGPRPGQLPPICLKFSMSETTPSDEATEVMGADRILKTEQQSS